MVRGVEGVDEGWYDGKVLGVRDVDGRQEHMIAIKEGARLIYAHLGHEEAEWTTVGVGGSTARC